MANGGLRVSRVTYRGMRQLLYVGQCLIRVAHVIEAWPVRLVQIAPLSLSHCLTGVPRYV